MALIPLTPRLTPAQAQELQERFNVAYGQLKSLEHQRDEAIRSTHLQGLRPYIRAIRLFEEETNELLSSCDSELLYRLLFNAVESSKARARDVGREARKTSGVQKNNTITFQEDM